jgi:predicted metal-dependent hydrolase
MSIAPHTPEPPEAAGDPLHDTRSPAPPIPDAYDPRYLAGVVLFNRGEYFDAHEVWEDLWRDCPSADRRFYQSLIQAAVALYHWGNGNRAGAARLFHSGRGYAAPYRPAHRGLDLDRFWQEVQIALAGALGADAGRTPSAGEGVTLQDHPLAGARGSPGPRPHAPRIELAPPPDRWPDPDGVGGSS